MPSMTDDDVAGVRDCGCLFGFQYWHFVPGDLKMMKSAQWCFQMIEGAPGGVRNLFGDTGDAKDAPSPAEWSVNVM